MPIKKLVSFVLQPGLSWTLENDIVISNRGAEAKRIVILKNGIRFHEPRRKMNVRS